MKICNFTLKKSISLSAFFVLLNIQMFAEPLTLPLDVNLSYTHGNSSTTLAEIIKKHDADGLLLQFWTTTCPHCIAALPMLKNRAEALREKKVIVVGINLDNKSKADGIRLGQQIETPWLVESSGTVYRKILSEQLEEGFRIPHAVLIDATGTVFYSDHPGRPEFDAILEAFPSPSLPAVTKREQQQRRLFDLRAKLNPTRGGEGKTLKELVQGHKGLLIDYWASWCPVCSSEKHRDALARDAEELSKQGVKVIAVNVDSKAEAERIRKEWGLSIDWLMESQGMPYAQFFGIAYIPTYVVISKEGGVVFKGSPFDRDVLEKALATLGVTPFHDVASTKGLREGKRKEEDPSL